VFTTGTDSARHERETGLAVASCPVLVERERELAFLHRVADAVEQGSSQLVVLTGEAGAGKSRLAQELLAELGPGWRRLRLSAEGGVPVPVGTQPVEVRGDHAPDAAIGAALARTLVAARGPDPLVAVLDDCERVDPVAVASLATAVDILDAEPVLLLAMLRLGVHRPGSPAARTVADVLRRPSAHEVRLPPLSVDGVAAMGEALGRALDDDAAANVHARTGGNPFFAEEVLFAPDGSVPWTVTELVTSRLEPLTHGAREAAELLAVAGQPLATGLLERIVGDVGDVASLVDAGIACEDGNGNVALRHALVGDVVLARTSEARRRGAHAALARALTSERDVSTARLARHWYEAGDVTRAAHHARIAADDAARNRAYRTATELYRIALDQPGHGADDPQLLDRAAVAAGWAGLTSEALERAQAADAAYRRCGEPWRAVAMWTSPALEHLPKPALDHTILGRDTFERLLQESQAESGACNLDRGAELARRALQLIEDSDADTMWKIAAAQRLIGAGRLAEGEEQLQRVRAMAIASGDLPLAARALAILSETAVGRGDFEAALTVELQAVAAAHHGGEAGAWTYDVGLAIVYAFRGDLDEASARVDRLFAMDVPIVTEFTQMPACEVDLARGRLDDAARRLDRLRAVTALGVERYTTAVLLQHARWHHLRGDPAAALAALDEADEVTREMFVPSQVDRLVLRVRSGLALDAIPTVEAAARELDQLAALGGGPGVQAAATWAHALLDAHGGNADDAATRVAAAAARWEEAARFLHAAETWCDAADVAARAGGSGAEFLARAAELATSGGFATVEARLVSGERAAPEVSVVPAVFERLSPREREIATLVAAGRTNREIGEALFISEHTVRNQLVSVFDKLGITRRTELARLVTDPSTPPRA
jgi:DNA-binding CsgD family transcriptional regulator/tetratricopeptide (TPR) repeat protein